MGSHDGDNKQTIFDKVRKLLSELSSEEGRCSSNQKKLNQAVEITLKEQRQGASSARIAANFRKIREYYYGDLAQVRHLVDLTTRTYRLASGSVPSKARVVQCDWLCGGKFDDARLLLVEIIRARDMAQTDHAKSGRVRFLVPSCVPWPRCRFADSMTNLLLSMQVNSAEEEFLLRVEPILKIVYGVQRQFAGMKHESLEALVAVLNEKSFDSMHEVFVGAYTKAKQSDVSNIHDAPLSKAIEAYANDLAYELPAIEQRASLP